MRALVLACFTTGLIAVAPAAQASKAIWASGNIPAGLRVTATHPCGRPIECTGGTSASSKTRHCRWL